MNLSTVLLPALIGAPVVNPNDFSLSAKVVYACQNGPVVIRMELAYRGPNQITLWQSLVHSQTQTELPSDWERKIIIRGVNGRRTGMKELRPNDSWVEWLFLHHDTNSIPAGRATLKCEWPVVEFSPTAKQQYGRVLAEPSVTVDLEVLAMTSGTMTEIRRSLLERLDSHTDEDLSIVVNAVRNSRHPDLIPVALRLIDSDYPGVTDLFIEYVYANCFSNRIANGHLLDLVRKGNRTGSVTLFYFWSNPHHSHRVSDGEIREILNHQDIWIRAMSFATFCDRCESVSAYRVMKELRGHTSPPSSQLIDTLFERLDSPRFREREFATIELLRFGDGILPTLEQRLSRTGSAEVDSRVRRMIAQLRQDSENNSEAVFLQFFEHSVAPGSEKVLRILAEGNPHSSLVKKAIASLERRVSKKERP